jgi:steroid 5-alpha reductase family enzyme
VNTFAIWLGALPWMLGAAFVAWLIATARRNAGLVDIFWSLFILIAGAHFAGSAGTPGARTWLTLSLLTLWALRLSAYLAYRNWNAPEDHRYQAIRARNEPGFTWKSLYLVFGLQALLALVVATPLLAATTSSAPLQALDFVGATLIAAGLCVESLADTQLARFRADPTNRGRVLDTGLWRYSRHPNYFGEFCVWWGFFLLALATGAWWSMVSPLLMSVLLLRVSGVTLLEQDIGQRRPDYARYIARTNAFFPGPRRSA